MNFYHLFFSPSFSHAFSLFSPSEQVFIKALLFYPVTYMYKISKERQNYPKGIKNYNPANCAFANKVKAGRTL